jgi:hypothetical protein
MWSFIITKLLGLLTGDLVKSVAAFLERRASDALETHKVDVQASTQVALATVAAEIETRKLQQQLILAESGWWVTAWVRPLLVYPCILHFGAIVLDSTFALQWSIAKLPPPYDSFEQTIILSFFIARPIEKIARTFVAARAT